MRPIRIAGAFMLALAPAAFAQGVSPAARAAATITEADVKAHIAFLASDALKGRDTPSPGLDTAAAYVANHFQALGLKPAGDAGTFIQRWPYNVRKLDLAKLSVELHGQGHSAPKYGSEFFIIPSAALDTMSGEIVFAGVAAPSSTADASFKGNIVTFAIPGAKLNAEWQQRAQGAVMAAMVGGARGVVLVLDPAIDAGGVGMIAGGTEAAQAPMPILGIRNDVASAWLKGSSADPAVQQPAGSAPKLVPGTSVRIRTAVAALSSNPPNAVAIIEGSDPDLKTTYVVYSAHMDHIGVSAPDAQGDSINNGADDDASGTSAILELAQAFTSMQPRPKRSIIFLLVSGEEKGLFGSKHFVEHPPVPATQIVANINLDMIGRNASDTTVAIGQDYSSLGPLTQAVVNQHPDLALTVAPDLWPEERLFFRSDHFNFAMKRIPAIFFTSGLHDEYHQPADEAGTIDADKLVRTARLVFWLGHEIANSAVAPTWTEAGLQAVQAAGANAQ